ncbi:AAA family ATPase [Nocardia sp. NPDC059246]|uniref:helix-turn-helix transcriptional regulator n=1 Tax=unclassified Nocardia TaxID=2637762 RepID=UPI00368E0BB7
MRVVHASSSVQPRVKPSNGLHGPAYGSSPQYRASGPGRLYRKQVRRAAPSSTDWTNSRRRSSSGRAEWVVQGGCGERRCPLHSEPLRGRSEPMRRALAVLRGASRHGTGGIIWITGAAGLGKTALLSEICRQAERTGMRVAAGRCDIVEQVQPGATVLGLLRSGRDPLLATADYAGIVAQSAEPLLLVEAVASALENRAATAPLLLAVDDVDRADRVSQFLLRTVIPRLVGLPVVWVLTTRDDDVDADLPGHGLAAVEQIRLGPLALPDLAMIAQDRLGHLPDQRLRGYLDAIDGNPALAVQIIDNVARATARDDSDTVSVEFTAAIAARLAQLGPAARDLVQTVAIAGRAVPVPDLGRLGTASSEQQLPQALSGALESGLLRAEGERVDCRHDLVRAAVCAGIPAAPARRLHRSCAVYYLAASEELIAAAHAREAIGPGDLPGATTMVQVAESLVAAHPEEAGELAALAFRAVRPDQPAWLDLSKRCLSVLCRTQRSTEAITVADLILARLDDNTLVAEVETQVAQALWLSGRISDLVTRTERVLGTRTLEPTVTARLRAAAALANTRIARGPAAIRVSEAALDLARTVDDREALGLALQAAGEAAKNDARHLTALGHFRELRALGGVSYLAEEIIELQFLDRYDHAQALLDQARTDHCTTEAILPASSGSEMWLDFNLGRLHEADAAARALIDLGRTLGNTEQACDGAMVSVAVALLQGDIERADQHIRTTDEIVRGGDHTRKPVVGVMRGWLAAARGEFESAMATWRPVLDGAGVCNGYWPLWPCWTGLFFKIGDTAMDHEFTALATAVAEVAASRNPGVASFEGMALNLRGRNSGDLDLIGRSAQVLARSPRPLLRACGAESYGRALLAAGDRSRGLTELDRAWEEFHTMNARAKTAEIQNVMRAAGARRSKWLVTLHHSTDGWASLTPSERRVAALIGAGHTNKSAAAELGISVNTIGTHLRSAFTKLGIQSRVQLANTLHSLPSHE